MDCTQQKANILTFFLGQGLGTFNSHLDFFKVTIPLGNLKASLINNFFDWLENARIQSQHLSHNAIVDATVKHVENSNTGKIHISLKRKKLEGTIDIPFKNLYS